MRMGVGHQLVRVSFGHAGEKQIAGFRTITVKETVRSVDPVVNVAFINLHPQNLISENCEATLN